MKKTLSNSYTEFTTSERFFIMNALLEIMSRQRKKNRFNAVRKFKKEHRANGKFSRVSIQAYSNLLTNTLQKYCAAKIQHIYNTKYRQQFDSSSAYKETPLNNDNQSIAQMAASLNSLHNEIMDMKLLLQQLTSKKPVFTYHSNSAK